MQIEISREHAEMLEMLANKDSRSLTEYIETMIKDTYKVYYNHEPEHYKDIDKEVKP